MRFFHEDRPDYGTRRRPPTITVVGSRSEDVLVEVFRVLCSFLWVEVRMGLYNKVGRPVILIRSILELEIFVPIVPF